MSDTKTTATTTENKPVGIVIDKVSAIRSGILFGSGFFAATGFSSLSTEFWVSLVSAIVTVIWGQYARQPSQLLSYLSAFEQVYRIFTTKELAEKLSENDKVLPATQPDEV